MKYLKINIHTRYKYLLSVTMIDATCVCIHFARLGCRCCRRIRKAGPHNNPSGSRFGYDPSIYLVELTTKHSLPLATRSRMTHHRVRRNRERPSPSINYKNSDPHTTVQGAVRIHGLSGLLATAGQLTGPAPRLLDTVP